MQSPYIYLHQGERKDAGKSPNLIFIYGVILHHIYIWQYFKHHNLQLIKVYTIHCFLMISKLRNILKKCFYYYIVMNYFNSDFTT